MFVMLFVMLFVSIARQVALIVGVQCTFVSDRSLSKCLLHTQVNGSNLLSYLYVEAYVINVVCGSYFGI